MADGDSLDILPVLQPHLAPDLGFKQIQEAIVTRFGTLKLLRRETRLTSAISLLDNEIRELISTFPVQSFHFSCYKSKWSFPNFS